MSKEQPIYQPTEYDQELVFDDSSNEQSLSSQSSQLSKKSEDATDIGDILNMYSASSKKVQPENQKASNSPDFFDQFSPKSVVVVS